MEALEPHPGPAGMDALPVKPCSSPVPSPDLAQALSHCHSLLPRVPETASCLTLFLPTGQSPSPGLALTIWAQLPTCPREVFPLLLKQLCLLEGVQLLHGASGWCFSEAERGACWHEATAVGGHWTAHFPLKRLRPYRVGKSRFTAEYTKHKVHSCVIIY